MLSPVQEKYILQKAYVPEHIISLMVGISQGEPFYENDFVFFRKKDFLIFIGYPLSKIFRTDDFAWAMQMAIKKFRPLVTWFIAPEIPDSLSPNVEERESDFYYILPISSAKFNRRLLRETEKAAQGLFIEKSRNFSPAHTALTGEILERENFPLRIKELFSRWPEYVKYSPSSLVLSAWDKQKNLAAFYILELAAEKFIAYVLGGYSQKNYIPHASDLLFFEMYKLAKETNKEYIHLGMGVSEGIRRFKMKWGGIPHLKYEAGAIWGKLASSLSSLRALERKL